MSTNESFLSRWSRRKRDSRRPDDDPAPGGSGDDVERERKRPEAAGPEDAGREAAGSDAVERAAASSPGAPSVDRPAPVDSREPARVDEAQKARPIELPPIASLTPQSDFRPFMQKGVDAATRNAALAQLFRDPHFNVMDGLDVYIDDYTRTEPIPSTMLAKLRQLHTIGRTDDEIDSWASADADASPGTLANAGNAKAPADEAVGNQAQRPTIHVAQADPVPESTRREDAAAEPNPEETNGEDEGPRM